MTCRPLTDDQGRVIGWACSRGSKQTCSVCKTRPSSKLCDFKLTGSKAGKTCDRPLCERCAQHIGRDTDLCPAHAKVAV